MKLVAILLVALLTIGLMGGCQAGTTGTEPNKISTLEEEKGKTSMSAHYRDGIEYSASL